MTMEKLLLLVIAVLLLAGCDSTASTPSSSPSVTSAREGIVTNTAAHDHVDSAHYHAVGLNAELYFDGALAEELTIQDCTLSDGTETTCYATTIAGYPANYDVGPFCPDTTIATAEEGGIWFDGDAVYDIDGAFILGLADLYDDSNWKLYDDDGNVNIIDTPRNTRAKY